MVAGVRMAVDAVTVGEGGKTNKVCEGSAETEYFEGGMLVGNAMLLGSPWSLSGGGACFRDKCFRRRGDSLLSCAAIGVTGEGGTGGSVPKGRGRRLPLPGAILKLRLAGGRDMLKESLVTCAEGGAEKCAYEPAL